MGNIINYYRPDPSPRRPFTITGLLHTMVILGLVVVVLCSVYALGHFTPRTDRRAMALGCAGIWMSWFGWVACLLFQRPRQRWLWWVGLLLGFVTVLFICLPQFN